MTMKNVLLPLNDPKPRRVGGVNRLENRGRERVVHQG